MATKSSTKNKSTLTGTSVADILTVKHDQVTVNGAGGNDTIKITKGNSSNVSGGAGADAITVSLGRSHVIHGNAGNDTITIGKSAGTGIKIYGDAGNDIIKATNSYGVIFYGGDGNDTLTGGSGADKLYGDAGTDKLYGGAGNDILSGGAGNDTLNGQAGNDTLTGGAGKDTFVYTNGGGSDKITDYAPGYDTLQISSGSISKTTLANSSKDLVFTVGTGKVTLSNAAAKTISMKDSRGSYTASKTAITLGSNFSGTMDVAKYLGTVTTVNGKSTTKTVSVKGNAKANTLYGGSGANTIYGYAGNDKLYGYAGNDTLYGGDGDDTLNGGDGNDTLYGGAGADTLTGGAGKDTFVYLNGEGNDTITDYASGQDTLQISNGFVSNMELANNNKDLVFTVGDGSVTVKDAAAKSIRMQDSRGSYTVTRRTITLGSDFAGTLDAAEVMPTVTTINGEAATGNTEIKVNGSNRNIYGGMGQDQLSAEGNYNTLYGGAGDDTLEVKGTGNYLSGDEGNDEYIVNWPLREEHNSGEEYRTVTIDNAFADESDSDTLVINGADSSNFTFSLSADDTRNLVIREEASGDHVVVYDWVNHGFESVTFDDKAFTNDEIREIIAEASRTKIDWNLGDTVALEASEIGTGLQINGYKENDFVVTVITLDNNEQLVMRDAQGGTLTISNWDENTLEEVAFKADGYKKVFTAEEFAGGIFTSITLANEEGQELVYDSGSDVCEEFDINFTTSTNIVINSVNGAEDRIKFTDNHSVDNVDIQIMDNDLYLYNWDPQAKKRIDGQIVIKGIMNSTVKTIEFGEMTYHLIGKETKAFVGSDTVTDRYLFLDTVWNGTDTTTPNWEVTIDGINGQDVLDFHFLPNNSRYYDLSGQVDGNDMVLTYRYSIDKVNGATLGTVRLKDFYNDDGTINTANGYPMIRTNREIYAGGVSDSAWDRWEWILDKNYRWLSLNAGTAGDDVIDLGNETRPTNTNAWIYYAGDGNDTVTAQAGDIVYGGTGNDTINATGSISDIHGGAGTDTIVVRGSDGQNLDHVVVRADKGNDIITAYGSYHYVHGGADDDEIHLRDDGNGTDTAHNSAAAGGVGNDTIIIHAGHDHRAAGGDGNDKLYAYLGDNHVLNGGAGDDEIHIIDDGTKRSENNRALGGEGNDWLYIENGGSNHYLYGDAGNDYLSVAGDDNTLNGGTGSDTYSVTSITADTNISIDQSSYNSGDADVLQLTSVDSSSVHYSLQDGILTITHDNGGTISVSGWDANPLSKVVFADNTELTGAEITELATADNSIVTVNESKTYTASGTGTIFQVTGAGYNAVLMGTSNLDTLDLSQYTDGEYGCNMSQSGNDLVIEVAEYTGDQVEEQTHIGTVTLKNYFTTDDRLSKLRRCEYEDGSVVDIVDLNLVVGGNYNENVAGTDGVDWIVTGNGNKTVNSGAGDDYIQVGWGDTGSAGTQIINAGAGDDEISADGGQNTLNGEAGNDDIFVENTTNNTLNGGAGKDRLEAYGSGHTLNGGENDDVIISHADNSTLNGGSGNDEIVIGYGKYQIVDGGAGNDTIEIYNSFGHNISGGAGSDRFVFATHLGSENIVTFDQSSFNAGDTDVLELKNYSKDDISSYSLQNGVMTLETTAGGKFEIQGWDVNPLSKVIFADNAELTGAEITELATTDVILETYGDWQKLNGKTGDDTLTAIGNGNSLFGGAGNDTLTATGNGNSLYGGAGNDALTATGDDNSYNSLYGGDGDDTLTINEGNSNSMSGDAGSDTYVVNTVFAEDANITIIQSEYENGDTDALQLTQVHKDAVTYSLFENTLVITHNGGGVVNVQNWDENPLAEVQFAGGETITSAEINETLGVWVGTNGDDELTVTAEDKTFFGIAGNDNLSVTGNNNYLYGGNGDDAISVSGGYYNRLIGGIGSDTYSINNIDSNTCIIIDQDTSYIIGDADILHLPSVASSEIHFSMEYSSLTVSCDNGGIVEVYNWNANPLSKIVLGDGTELTTAEVYTLTGSVNKKIVDWTLGDHVTISLADVGDTLMINGYKKNDFVITKDAPGISNLTLTDAKGGTITISDWPMIAYDGAPNIEFAATGYTEFLTGYQVHEQLFYEEALPNNGPGLYNYNDGASGRKEYDINFNTLTNIAITSNKTTPESFSEEKRIKFTDNHSVDNVDIQIRGNDLYLYNWDPQAKQRIDGQVVIKDIKNSTVKTIEFGEMTYHLIGEETKTFVGSDTVTDRYLFLDTVWNGTDTTAPNWEVTIDGINGQDVLDFHFLPNNSRYYDLSGQVDRNDMVLTYRYSIDKVNGAVLGTVRLKDFYNDDGTLNTTNGYPKIRTNREIYAGDVSDSAWDSWEWVLDKNYRWLSLNAGTAGDDVIDLRNETRPTDTKAWFYYAGDGNDTVTAQAGDIVYGGTGDDTINATGSVSDVHGGAGADTIVVRGADGQNLDHVVVRADKGNDIITAYGSYHYVHGGADDDEIHIYSDETSNEVSHNNAVSGGAGNDTIYIHAGHDHIVNGADGDDIIYVEGNNNRLSGGDGADMLTVVSGTGNTLRGGSGNDILDGGIGDNTLFGNDGNDVFVFNQASNGSTVIRDYEMGLDRIEFNDGVDISSNSIEGDNVLLNLTNGGTLNIVGAVGKDITFDYRVGNSVTSETRIFQ